MSHFCVQLDVDESVTVIVKGNAEFTIKRYSHNHGGSRLFFDVPENVLILRDNLPEEERAKKIQEFNQKS